VPLRDPLGVAGGVTALSSPRSSTIWTGLGAFHSFHRVGPPAGCTLVPEDIPERRNQSIRASGTEDTNLAQIKIEKVMDKLDSEIRRALEDTFKEFAADVECDPYEVFRFFRRRVATKCRTWETIPDTAVNVT